MLPKNEGERENPILRKTAAFGEPRYRAIFLSGWLYAVSGMCWCN